MRRVLRFFGRWLYRLVFVVGLVTLVVALVVATIGWRVSTRLAERTIDVPETFVLTADWRGGVPEKLRGFAPLRDFGFDGGVALPDVLLTLDRAVDDARVKGVVVRIDGAGFGTAQVWELREALARLRAAGKFTAVYADTLGELEGGMAGTYLASAVDHVQLQPLGTLGFTGLSSERPYAARLLDDLGIGFQVVKREDYKSALETFTRSGPSPEAAAMTDRLLDGLFDTFLAGVAEGRGLDVGAVRAALDAGPLRAEDALAAGLIDAVAHIDAFWATVQRETGTDERVELRHYRQSDAFADADVAATVGFVHAVGPIRRGQSDDPLGDLDIAGDSIAEAIDQAREAMVDSILLRVSSPGGSAVASETIAAAVRRAQAAGIPVVVSMGDVAASGGYWISMDADRILAAPTTLTGSIGVIAGKPALRAFLADLGIDIAIKRRGANAGFGSLVDPWDAEAEARIESLIDDLYRSFLDGVAEGRGMSIEAVRPLAGGRVWLGAEAAENGLVDGVGGFVEAVDAARSAAGAAAAEPVALEQFPKAPPPFMLLLEEFGRFLELATRVGHEVEVLTAPPALRLDARPLPVGD